MNNLKLTTREKSLVIALCENNLRVSGASEDLNYHRNTITYQCKNIKRKTGLNPLDFFDAQRLYDMCWDNADYI